MATKVTTLKNAEKTDNLLPRTELNAIFDSDGNYLDSNLKASDLNALKGGTVDELVRFTEDGAGTPIPTDADTLEGHDASYFATADALLSLNDKKIIRVKDVNIGSVSVPSTGYVDISGYQPSYDGYTLLSCAIKNYGSFTAGTPSGFFLDANGRYFTGPASSTIANITVRYIFVKTENLYDN